MAEPLIPISIQEQLNKLAIDKARDLLHRAQRVLSSPKFIARKELLDSLTVTTTKATDTTAPVITLSFAEQGKYLEVKRMSWGKVPDIAKLIKWVQGIGVSRFRYVSGYAYRSGLSEEKKIEKIAAGVAWSYRRHMTDWKPKRWKKQTLVAILKELNIQTAVVWRDGIVAEVDAELMKKQNR